MFRFVLLFEFPKALARFMGFLSGEEAVSIAAQGRAKAVGEATHSVNGLYLA